MLVAKTRLMPAAVRSRHDRARGPKERDKPIYGGFPDLEANGKLFPGPFARLPGIDDPLAKLYR